MKPHAELYAMLAPCPDARLIRTSFVQGHTQALQRAQLFTGIEAIENMSTHEVTRVRDANGAWCALENV